MLTNFTDREREVIRAALRGDSLECSDLDPEQLRDTVDPGHIVRGQVLRDLLLGRHGELDPRGVRLTGARITGEIDLRYVDASVGLKLRKCAMDQIARFEGAHLPWLNLRNADLQALHGNNLRVDGDLLLDKISATSSHEVLGTVDLRGAHVAGDVLMSSAKLTNTSGPALVADRLQVDGSLFLDEGFVASGDSERGTVCLPGAHVKASLDMNGAELTNTSGPALIGDYLRVDAGLYAGEGLVASGNSERGAVRIAGAHITGILSMDGAKLTNTSGPALVADRLQVDGDLLLDKTSATSSHEVLGTVDLRGAHVAGDVLMSGAKLANTSGRLLLVLWNLRCLVFSLNADLICRKRGRSRTCLHGTPQLRVDGFIYSDLGDVGWERWLHLVRCHTPSYRPMPYQQLAAIRTAAGHDRDTRRILVAQQQDHRTRGDLGGLLRRALHVAWGGLTGYGYRTGRTALALLTVLLLAGGMGWWAGHTTTMPGRYAAEHPANTLSASGTFTRTTTSPGACSTVELIGLGIDRGLPLASTGIRTRCDLDTASAAGQWFTVTIWLLQAAVWALATLALAGYTGLIRKIR